MPILHRDAATSPRCWTPSPRSARAPGPQAREHAQRPALRELLHGSGARRPALHEQFQQPGRRHGTRRSAWRWRRPVTWPATRRSPPCGVRGAARWAAWCRSPVQHQRRAPSPITSAASLPVSTAWFAPSLLAGVAPGYTTGTQWTRGFERPRHHRYFPGRPLWQLHRMDQALRRRRRGYGYSANQMWRQIFIPGLQPRTAQGQPAPTSSWPARGRLSRRARQRTAAAYITPFARLQGYTGDAKRLHRNRRAVAQPHRGGADHELAAHGVRRPVRRRDRPRLAREARSSRSGWAGAMSMPIRRGR